MVANNSGRNEVPWGSITQTDEIVYEANDEHPETASVSSQMKRVVRTEGRELTWKGILSFTSDRENFYYSYTRQLLAEDQLIREKTWNETIPRDYQ